MNKPELMRNLVLGGMCALVGAGAVSLLRKESSSHVRDGGVESRAPASSEPEVPSGYTHSGFWQTLQITADESEGYKTLSEMAQSADGVVIGKLAKFRLSRVIPTSDQEIKLNMMAVDVEVSEHVRGPNPGKRVTLEFYLPGRWNRAGLEKVVRDQERTMPTEPVLVFLRKIGPQLHRTVNSYGVWTADAHGVYPPLSIDWATKRASAEALVQRVEGDPAELAREKALIAAHGGATPAQPGTQQRSEHETGDTERDGVHDELMYELETAGLTSIAELAQHVRK